MTWYAVCEDQSSRGLTPEEAAVARVWTVSRSPDQCGWITDSGVEGYGLTRADAEFLARAANAAEAGRSS